MYRIQNTGAIDYLLNILLGYGREYILFFDIK